MNLLRAIKARYPLPPLVWYMIIETAIARTAFFMVMPFIALRMHGVATNSITLIGAIIGFGPLVALFIGFYVGHLSDHWGRRQLVIAAMSLWALVFFGFAFASTPLEFAILMAINGLARGVFDPVSTALLSDICIQSDPTGEQKKNAFHLRYASINIGAGIGPLLGGVIILTSASVSFIITSVTYAISVALFVYFSKRYKLAEMEEKRGGSQKFAAVIDVLARDRVLQIYMVAFGCITLALAQIDTVFAVYLKTLFHENGVVLFSKLYAVNGFLVVLLTMPLLAWTKRFHLNHSCAVSALIWGLGYFVLAFSHLPSQFYFAMILLTLGEIVVFANGYLIIEELAPENMKGAYLGSANISNIGFVIGPTVGGWLFEVGDGRLLFSVMGLLLFVSAGMYIWAKRSSPRLVTAPGI